MGSDSDKKTATKGKPRGRPFQKGNTAGPGRTPGKPNKHTAELKDMIRAALDGAGGVDYLIEKAHDPRTASAFLTLVGRTLPMTVKGPGENGEHRQMVTVEFVARSDS